MATTYPIAPRYKITPLDNERFLVIGNPSDVETGLFRVQFVPSETFVGQFQVMGRASGPEAHVDEVGFGKIPYRVVQSAGQASLDESLVSAPIAADIIIRVPASGLAVALLVECTAGYGYVYSQPLVGTV